jgi:DNA-directed RNA polymerase subunit alpha
MIQISGNIVTVNDMSIHFDTDEKAYSFLLDYVSKHNQQEQQVIENTVYVEVPVNKELNEHIENFGEIEIEYLDLSVRSFNCLKRGGINKIEDILKLDYNAIIRVRNLGRRSVMEIEEKVNELLRSNFIKWTNNLEVY